MEFKIPYGRQSITEEDISGVVEALKADFLTQGPRIRAFEDAFATYVGADYAVAVSNATAGLHLACMSLGVQEGHRVITTPITFAASANCVRYCGGEVWFADIHPDTYLLDLESVRKLVESKPRGFFKGMIPVDFGGLPVDLDAYRKLADEHGLWLIEDACHAPGGYFEKAAGKQFCGNGKFAKCSIFSFHPVKHIACGEGGMITTNSKNLYERLLRLRSHGISKEDMIDNHGGWYYEMHELGYNYRLTDIQSALGLSQLAKNNKGLIRRNEIAHKYMAELGSLVKCQTVPKGFYHAYHLFIIEVAERKAMYDFLREKGIYSQIHYIPIHTLPYYQEIGYKGADLSHAEAYYDHCISLPMYPTLKEEEQNYVIDCVKEFLK